MKNKLLLLLVCASAWLTQMGITQASEPSYLLAAGVPGDTVREKWSGHVEVFGYSHEVISPRDSATGLPTGKRQHGTFKIIKRVGNNSPILMQKLVQNGSLSQVDLKLTRMDPSGDGTVQHYYTYTLKNARIVSIRNWTPNSLDTAAPDVPPMEEVSFVYQSIAWTYEPGKVTFEDSLSE